MANDIGLTLRIDGNTVGDGNHELLLTQSQMNKLTNAYNPVNIKLSKTQLKKMIQEGGNLPKWLLFPGAFFGFLKSFSGGNLDLVGIEKLCGITKELN